LAAGAERLKLWSSLVERVWKESEVKSWNLLDDGGGEEDIVGRVGSQVFISEVEC
jgi:hypothetical protein